MSDTEEEYTPDPNAPWWNKLNPCHIDHIYALDRLQWFFEMFAPHCQCCAGMRVFVLLLAVGLAFLPKPWHIIAVGLAAAVIVAIGYDSQRRLGAAGEYLKEQENDNGNES